MNTQLPDAQTAYNNVFDGVYARVFFTKCATAGYSPQTPEEAEHMLAVAGNLRQVEQSNRTKQASAGGPFAAMRADLDRAMTGNGYVVEDNDAAVKQAADALLQDPTIYNSILALKANEAAAIEQQFATR